MQAELKIECSLCKNKIGTIKIDTAFMPEELQAKINKPILKHRNDCRYYK